MRGCNDHLGYPPPQLQGGSQPFLYTPGPRPSRVSQTPRCCHLGRQGTRAACVMGVGNKDAQDPEPRAPGTSHPNLHELFSGVSMPDCPGTALNPPRSAYKVEHASAPPRHRNQCLGFWGESAFPAQLRAYTPTPPSLKQARTSNPQPAAACGLSAGHSRPPRAGRSDLRPVGSPLQPFSTPSCPKQKRSHEGASAARCKKSGRK